MGRPVPPQSRVRAPHRLLWPLTAAAAGAALIASTVQTPPQARPDAAPVAALSCSNGVWKADYYANTTLTGTPRKSLCDKSISENWGKGHPAGISLPNDRFGVRWTMRRNFGGGGPFLLKTAAQDGIRVWIDSKRYVNLWHDYSSTQHASVKVTVPAGTHTVRVDYTALTGSANVSVSLAPNTPDKVAPLAPASPKAVRGDGRATVSWARNAEADLAGYRVYRSTSTPVAIDTAHRISGSGLLTGSTFTSTGLRNGTKYWFAVTAVDRSGNQSRASANVSAVPADTTPPRAPDLLGADGYGDIDLNGNGVPDPDDDLGENHLSWGPSWDDDYSTRDSFAGYHVYRATAPGGPWARIRSADARVVQENAYSDKDAPIGITAYYRVTAVDTAGNESTPATTEPGEYASTTASALRPDTGLYPPQQPTGLKGELAAGAAALDWADNPVGSPVHGLTAGYQVQSASSASGPWTLRVGDAPLTSSKFTDTTLPEGGTRYYRVRAVGKVVDADTPRAYSAWTEPVAVSRPVPPDTTPPVAPAAPEVTAPDGGTTATLTWTTTGWPGYDADFAGYQVTRSADADGPFTDTGSPRTPQCAAVSGTEDQVRCTLTDGPIAADATPYYRVVAVDETGNRSSGTVVQLKRLAPSAPKPPTPTGLTATRTDDGLLLDWDDSPASEVYLYYLYRTTYGSPCANADTFHTANSYYLDTSPWLRARYCLSVRGFEGNYSDPIWIDVSAESTETAPQAPEMPTASGTTDGIRLTWSVNDPAAARYEVWRRTETDAVYIKTADIPATTSPEWTDTDAPAGVPTCYRTVAVNAAGNRSGFSEDDCAVRPYPEGTARPDRPAGLAARQEGDNAVLSWQPVPGATRYLVYRYWGNAANPGTRIQDEPVTGTTVTDTAAPYTSSGAYYAVVAVDAAGVRSEAAVLPWMGDGFGASMTLAASGSADGVLLTWAWSCQSDWCPEPSSVTIERWNPATQVWDELTSTLPGTAVSYLDTAAPAGATSYYRVQVYGQDGDTPSQMGYGAVPGTRPAAPTSN
ncbi:fibronectin type III domain-containing protein [Streptomyces yaanensis]|uniref:Fibronectin type III domain-containing protein n=1 Tax=Streptomyces yaanensis TaxID=1142239 RepID=A0ABV7S9W3_9ACTN|nr:PA14 domain-containing protein [Streptomyces sp. CGMCC 4.7035]WNB96829.1 PA14 domain-containing protein [Streptomyces sp. CGMCC 4.7035]